MHLSIYGRKLELSEAIVRHVEDRIHLTLGTAAERITAVSVSLTDINGDRGGEDMRCRLVVYLRNAGPVVIDAVDVNLYTAIDDAAFRAKEAVWRHLKRRRTLRREYANRGMRRVLG